MDNDITIEMVMKEKTYSTKEISDYLNIADSTVRKWCLILEEHGYTFKRNEFQKREYTERDVIALHKFKDLTKDGAMSLEDAAIAIKTNYNRVTDAAITMTDTQEKERYDKQYAAMEAKIDALTDLVTQQVKFHEALLKRLDDQQRLFEERMEISDHRLLENVKMLTEAQKQLVAAKEEEDNKAKKGFFQRLFGK